MATTNSMIDEVVFFLSSWMW